MVNSTTLSDAKRKLLEKYRHGYGEAAAASVAPVLPRRQRESAPVSLSQEHLLRREFRNQGGPALYNESIRLRMRMPLDGVILKRSLCEIIRRHEIWRTSYVAKEGQINQIIHPAPEDIDLPVIDLRGRTKVEADADVERIAGAAVAEPFDFERGPLLRALLFRTADQEHLLFLTAHLSVVDGVSVYQVFPFELAALYRAHSSGQANPLADLTVQFSDYAHWQREWLQGGEAASQIDYWRKQLAEPIPMLTWPERPRPTRETFCGVIRSFPLRHELVEAMEALSRQEGVSLFMALLAAVVSLLHLYTRQDDIIVGTPSQAGRKRSEVQKLLGYFLNPVALRFKLDEESSFRALLRQAQQVTLEALSNDDVPLEVLAEELKIHPGVERNPFFTVAMSLQPPMPELEMDWSVTSMDIGSGGSPWDLYLAFINRPGETTARVQYNPDLFHDETIVQMISDYQSLLRCVTEHPTLRLSEVNI